MYRQSQFTQYLSILNMAVPPVVAQTELSKAADRCDVDALRELLSAGVDVDHTSPQCRLTALQIVCSASTNGHDDHRVACAALLLAHGASPNAGAPGSSYQNFTPLMFAALNSRVEIVKMLLSAGGDVNVIASGATALGAAVFNAPDTRANRDILEAFLRAGADANPPKWGGSTVMERSIRHGQRRFWPLLLRAGAILPTRDINQILGYHRTHSHLLYLQKIQTAGGFKAYEKAHRAKLLATFAPKFTHLVPPELVARFLEFSFHLGFY